MTKGRHRLGEAAKSFRFSWLIAFFLGSVVTLASVRFVPAVVAQPKDDSELTLVLPALSETTYTYRHTRGFMAVLETGDGRRLELPATWLPGEVVAGAQFLVTTQVQPGADELAFKALFRSSTPFGEDPP